MQKLKPWQIGATTIVSKNPFCIFVAQLLGYISDELRKKYFGNHRQHAIGATQSYHQRASLSGIGKGGIL